MRLKKKLLPVGAGRGTFCPPKADICLKNVMAIENVRKHFISAALRIPLKEIRTTRLLNTHFRKRYRGQKLGIVDLLVDLNNDTKVHIELQVARYAFWDRRCLFYLARAYAEDLWVGEDYRKLKRCVSISILGFNLTDDDECHKAYLLRDERGRVFSDVLEVHTIELKKPCGDDPLAEWVCYFNATSEEELDMIQTKNPGIIDAIHEVKRLSLCRMARMWYEDVLKERRDLRAHIEYVREEAKAEERINTEREKERADLEKERADLAEREIRKLREELKKKR